MYINGLKGRMVEFLKVAYMESRCEVKVGKMSSESFGVVKGLRQGCVLSPAVLEDLLIVHKLTAEQTKKGRGGWQMQRSADPSLVVCG